MKISMAALSFLILAAALGSQASIIPRFHHPSDCCFSYTSRRIRCTLMEDYFETSSGCPKPGVIFTTKKGQRVCANPSDSRVQDCMIYLTLTLVPKDLETLNLR
ncbi:C-C motif chemokine 23 [Heterocephalus glaber]|uniref:C-C motif chemokine n=1 Tax=Heterocephalus glaber TaxID=10181 RepID=G5B739_HETGA|nr:C-C motif chemokine 23 [Heterocephalus glaber]